MSANAFEVAGIHAEQDIAITMRDGVTLRANLFRPAEGGPAPALVLRLPYNKDAAQTYVYAHPAWYARHGYAVLVQDSRGRYASEGEFYPLRLDGEDGYDTIKWCAAQPWCNGSVGMIDCSYFALAQLLAAVHQPEALKAIFPYDAYTDMYRHRSTHGGVPHMGFASTWFSAVAALNLTSGRLGDPSGLRNMFDEGLSFSHPYDGEHYWRRSPSPHLDKVNIPVYFGCDWSFW